MAAQLIGAKQLKARLRAMRQVWKPVARRWADETVLEMKPHIPVRTGKTRKSVRRGLVTTKRATVMASRVVDFLDAGTKAHTIVPKKASVLAFDRGGTTIFAKRVNHPQTRGRRFKAAAATRALEKTDALAELTKLWNDAA